VFVLVFVAVLVGVLVTAANSSIAPPEYPVKAPDSEKPIVTEAPLVALVLSPKPLESTELCVTPLEFPITMDGFVVFVFAPKPATIQSPPFANVLVRDSVAPALFAEVLLYVTGPPIDATPE
jgi:hypothetical protein